MTELKSGLVYFGGKSLISKSIWDKIGYVENYVEPFCGSAAILLANPNPAKIETINDKDCLITNFWRAIKSNPELTASFANNPPNEIELHAKQKYITEFVDDLFISKIESDVDFCDYKIAGFWAWGLCTSIGNNWMHKKGLSAMPHLTTAGQGLHGLKYDILQEYTKLSERLKRTRIVTGDWKKVCTPGVSYNNYGVSKEGTTFVFLDPPYNMNGRTKVYKHDDNVFKEVEDWCLAHQICPDLKVSVCGYQGDYNLPDWEQLEWQTNGGFSSLGNNKGKENSKKECIWFSPSCK